MIVNQQNLNGIYTGYKTLFQKAFLGTTTLWEKVATKVPSEAGEESYKWLGSMPKLRKWVGNRQVKNLEASDYTIKNESFETTVSIPKEAVEDDKISLYTPTIQNLGMSAAAHPDQLVFELLAKGFEENCYDKKTFFAADHKVGKKTISNKGTAKLSATSYMSARSKMMSITDEEGKPLKLIPDMLVVPPSLESEARKILLADQIDGTTNTMKGTAEVLVVPDLAGYDDAWYLLCTKNPIKPLIYQERKPPQFIAKTAMNDDNVFYDKELVYGVDKRGNAGYGLWQMAYGSTGTTA